MNEVTRALVLLSLACAGPGPRSGSGNQELPGGMTKEAPSIRGTITRRVSDRILIEEEPLDTSGSAKAMVRLTDTTRVVRVSGKPAGTGDLRTGQQVSAWFDGPVMESYPVQATAAAVRIEAEDGLEDQIDITGVIRYFELEGGFFAILSDDGETYNPTNLPPDFRQDGLPVVARAKLRNDLMGIHQAGPIVEIVEIRKR